ncbi:MAG: MerR family transcriptional regulator [Alphaproteobacteria bacterium]|nr:MerR family transcriptional regulator [Alphaproteobacteria bacterium]
MVESLNPMPLRRGSKSASAFRTISEVASELNVPQHVLRFWEGKYSQVSPLKRGGGRRYYRPEDIELLRRIRSLLYEEGYTIMGVQKLLRNGGPKDAKRSGDIAPPTVRAGANSMQREELRAVLGELEELRNTLRKLGS